MKYRPSRPSGNDDRARFMQWVYDTLISLQPISGPGVSVEQTLRGTMYRAKVQDEPEPVGSSEMRFRGEYSTETVYVEGDVVVVRGGVTAGLYISNTDGNTDTPDNSANWTQLADNNSIGRWGG